MESNAIRLGSKIEKVTIDFADLESLKKSSGFSRLYTIHTAKTNQMSQKLGFHVGGFCDDRGKGGSAFAAYLVGYDSLPSDAILCKMDSQYEYLPFNQEELDSLFDLLNDGFSLSPSQKAKIKGFFEEHHINPPLPDFPLPMEPILFAQLPKLILLCYDESRLRSQQDQDAFAKRQHAYWETLREKTDETGFFETRIAKDGTYYTRSQRYNGHYYLYFQAIEERGEEANIPTTYGVSPTFVDDDGFEEETKPNYHYFLEFQVDADWPDSEDHFHYASTDLFLEVNEEKRVDPNFEVPYFNDFVHFKGLDREKGTLRIEADQKHRKDEYLLKLDEPLAIAFDYIDTTPSSRRLGKATLVLRKMRNSMDSLSGKVRFAFEEWANGRRLDWDCEELKNPVSDIQRHELVELKDGDAYGVFMLDKESGYCLIYHFPQDENGDKTAFHLLKLDEEFRRVESFSESGSKIDLILKIDYLSS